MGKALQLAERGCGKTYPNPVVGALLVKNGRVVSEGYHTAFGRPHAEVEAIRKAGRQAKGSTLYVTLEPCSTFGKTPPCTRLIIEKEISHVVMAVSDPNPAHKGKGIRELQKNRIRVTANVLKKEAIRQNEVFFKWMTTGLPFVSLKMAETLDGKIATPRSESRWITGEKSRAFVQRLRSIHQAVLVGKHTALRDNPRLNVRIQNAFQPIKIILDPRLEVPLTHRIFQSRDRKVMVITTLSSFKAKFSTYDRHDIGLLWVDSKNGKMNLRDLLTKLSRMGIASLLIEGGGETAAYFLEAELVDKLYFFLAPKILGGRDAKTPVEGRGIQNLNEAIRIHGMKVSSVGGDFLITGYPVY